MIRDVPNTDGLRSGLRENGRRRLRRPSQPLALWAVAAVAVAVLAGLGIRSLSSSGSGSAVEFSLPTSEAPIACRGIGFPDPGVLSGSSTDKSVWLEFPDHRSSLVWPPGYLARIDGNKLQIVDKSGTVVLRGGDRITGACTSSKLNTWKLVPPFSR